MINKLILGLLIFLVVLSGGIGAYSYTLNQEIKDLNQQLTASQEEQATRLSTIDTSISIIKDNLDEQGVRITAVNDGVENLKGETRDRLDTLGQEINAASAQINGVEEKIAVIAERSSVNANELYQKATQATVDITDGDQLIGSGFLYSSGYVVTANHVIEGLAGIYVVFPDGRVSTATVAGASRNSDVAVLTLANEVKDIEPLTLADSSEVKVGDTVFTIGSPFSLSETFTSGVVSYVNRLITEENDSQTLSVANTIQFDAPANYGNSGCPLLNSRGEVIGLVVARINPGEGDGINYAISSNKVKRVATALIERGVFNYPWLGIGGSDLTPRMVKDRGLASIHGVLVGDVTDGGPASTAGVMVDDIILAIDETSIRNKADLTSYLGEFKSPGEPAILQISRGGATLKITVQLGTAP